MGDIFGGGSSQPSGAAAVADPFASQRSQYFAPLQSLASGTDPSSVALANEVQPGGDPYSAALLNLIGYSGSTTTTAGGAPVSSPSLPSSSPRSVLSSLASGAPSGLVSEQVLQQNGLGGLGFQFTPEQFALLKQTAQARGQDVSTYVRKALQQNPTAFTHGAVLLSDPQLGIQGNTNSPNLITVPGGSGTLTASSTPSATTSRTTYQSGSPIGGLASDPSYQFRLSQGMQGTERSLAARGLLNSGNALAELTNYAQGAASQEYQNQFSRLFALSQDQYNRALGINQNRFQQLALLSGATTGSPAAAGQLTAQSSSGLGNLAGTLGTAAVLKGFNPLSGLGSIFGSSLSGAGTAATLTGFDEAATGVGSLLSDASILGF